MVHAGAFTLPAPAKLNLFLHINGRREDGYHELQTLFQFLDYGDDITFAPATDGAIELTSELAGVTDETNLIMRAARLLQRLSPRPLPGVRITLEKRLPMGGGLGGGSSDAATTLVGLNHFWALDLSVEQLAEAGLSLGADVPVFVRGFSAWAEGVGEKLTPAEPEEAWYVVLKPDCDINTALIFSGEDLTRDTPRITIAPAFEGQDPTQWSQWRNDCEKTVCKLYPKVRESLIWLSEFGSARLTGTGACIFGVFPTESRARNVWASRPSGINGFVAKGVNRSPLHTKLTELE